MKPATGGGAVLHDVIGTIAAGALPEPPRRVLAEAAARPRVISGES